jgi:hypothetical protein
LHQKSFNLKIEKTQGEWSCFEKKAVAKPDRLVSRLQRGEKIISLMHAK